jgi:chemotaxis response regulator CheB
MMPQAALETGPVDFILPLDGIERLLRSLPTAAPEADR